MLFMALAPLEAPVRQAEGPAHRPFASIFATLQLVFSFEKDNEFTASLKLTKVTK